MKQKVILISYLNNSNLQSHVSREIMFNRIVDNLIAEGRLVVSTAVSKNSKKVEFNDNSIVIVEPFGTSTIGRRFTHMYFDANAIALANAETVMLEVYASQLISADNANFDISDEYRKLSFSITNGDIQLKII